MRPNWKATRFEVSQERGVSCEKPSEEWTYAVFVNVDDTSILSSSLLDHPHNVLLVETKSFHRS